MAPLNRRRLVFGIGSAAAVALAGCTDDAPGNAAGDDRDAGDDNDSGDDADDSAADSDADAGTDGGTADVVVRELSAPSWARRGDPFTVTVTIENDGDAEGRFRGRLQNRTANTDVGPIDVTVPAGETVRWKSPQIVADTIPLSGRLRLTMADHDVTAFVPVVEPLSIGEQYTYEDGVEVRIDGFVRKDGYEYVVGDGRKTKLAPDGETFLFVYLTVDVAGPEGSFPSFPSIRAIGVDVDGERRLPVRPSVFPAEEPLGSARQRYVSQLDPESIAPGLAAYDPEVVEQTARLPPEERTLGDRDPIAPGQSAWVLVPVPEDVELRGLRVLLSR